MERTYLFLLNDSLFIEAYYNGTPDTFATRSYSYNFKDTLENGIDTSHFLFINGGSYYYTLSQDTLTLDSRFREGGFQLFTR